MLLHGVVLYGVCLHGVILYSVFPWCDSGEMEVREISYLILVSALLCDSVGCLYAWCDSDLYGVILHYVILF